MDEKISAREFARRSACDERQVRRALRDGILVRDAAGKLDAAQLGLDWRRPNIRTVLKAVQRDADENMHALRDAWLASTAWALLQMAWALDADPGDLIDLLDAHVRELDGA